MNWIQWDVQENKLQRLRANNEPIAVPNGAIEYNAGVELRTLTGETLDAVYDSRIGGIRLMNRYNPIFNSMANRDLLLYNDHLLNEDVNTIVVDGFFGTGKTSTTCSHLVPGLMNKMNGGKGIETAYLSKPHEPLGKSYGHLPGDLAEKTREEFTSFLQYFERYGQPFLYEELTGGKQEGKPKPKALHLLVFEYLRGRDVDSGWVVLDEAQNTSNSEMASLVSRIGDTSKLVILGDSTPTQIDRRNNTSENNGLRFVKETFRDKKYAGAVEMQTIHHILRGQRVRDLFKALRS